MDRCTGRRDITEILMKTALNTIQSINQSIYNYLMIQLFLCSLIERSGTYCFTVVRLSVRPSVENTVEKGEIARNE